MGLADYKVRLKLPHRFTEPQSTYRGRVEIKGVGPSTTLAWPGWKQPDISVKMDRQDSKHAGSRKVV